MVRQSFDREQTRAYPTGKSRAGWVTVERAAPTLTDGLYTFEYHVVEDNQLGRQPFFVVNHKAQIRTQHQRIVTVGGSLRHVSGATVAPEEIDAFLATREAYRWVGKDGSGNWLDDRGRTLSPFVFAAAPWAGGHDEELDPQWVRETFTVSVEEQVQECIARRLDRVEAKRESGDHRGTTLNLQVGASAHDAYETQADTIFSASSSQIRGNSHTSVLGSRYISGARFTSATVPNGATINSATWSGYAYDTNRDDVDINVYGNDVDDAANFTTDADVTNRVLTTASVSDAQTSVGANWYSPPDVSTIVGEITSRAGWSSGNSLMVIIAGSSNFTRELWLYAYDGNTSLAPKLDIDYTASGGGGGAKSYYYQRNQ